MDLELKIILIEKLIKDNQDSTIADYLQFERSVTDKKALMSTIEKVEKRLYDLQNRCGIKTIKTVNSR